MNTSDIKQPRLLTLDDVQPIPQASRIDTLRLRRQNNLEKRYDTTLLAECEQSWQNKDEFRQQRARSLRYLFGNQWGDLINYRGCYMTEEKYMREIKRNEPLKNNIMVSLWSSVVGIHAKQETEPVCYARAENAKSLSDMMSSALQTNWQNTYMADMLDVVFAEYLISGAAFVRETYEERDQLHDAYTDYINPYYMFWNAGSDPAHRDVTLIGCLHDITPEELFFRFAKPQYALTVEDLRRLYNINALHPSASTQPQNDINSYNNVSFSTPSDGSMLRVIEVWRQEVKPRYQCHDPLAVSQVDAYFRIEKKDLPRIKAENEKRRKLYAEQQVPKEKQALITTREIVDKYWHFAFLTPEGFILAEGETPYDFKSHPFSMSLFPYVNGEIHSFISFFIDQQRYINRLVAMDNMAVTSAVKGMKFLPLSLKPDEMTTEEYLRFVCELREVTAKAIPAHVEEILTLCGLQETRGRLLGHMSKGYRQRAGIAQALCGSPEILILDEPTVGLDPKQTVEIRELIRRLQAEHTVVFSSHILSEVQQLCSRVIILDGGRMVRDFDRNEPETGTLRIRLKIAGEEGTVMPRLQHLDTDIRAELLPAEENGVTEARLVMEAGGDAGAAADRVFRLLAGAGIPVRMMRAEKETLEEVFLRETDRNNE